MSSRSLGIALLCASSALMASLVACGDDDASAEPRLDAGSKPQRGGDAGSHQAASDAGGSARQDAAVGQSIAQKWSVCTGEPPVLKLRDYQTNTELEPDWSCYQGLADAGTDAGDVRDVADDVDSGTDESTRTLRFGFEPMIPPSFVENASIDFFFGPSTLGTPALNRVFEGDAITIEVPGGITSFSARINPLARDTPAFSLLELREYGFPVPADDTVNEGFIVVRDSRALSVSLALAGDVEAEDPDKAMIFAFARDCRGRDLSGAQFELIDGETNRPVALGTARGEPRSSYLQYALPSATCTYTSADGLAWMMVNAPVNISGDSNTHPYRLRLQGRMHADDAEPTILGEREVELFSGVSSLVRLYR